jgi:dsDNA-specific endonuclease/ATPase MutS2
VVWEYLKAHPNVKSFRHPPDEEGGSGATVVELSE